MNIIEKAIRAGVRFETTKGNLTVEDLIALPLKSARGPSVDSIAIALNVAIESMPSVSFVTPTNTGNSELTLALDVVKYIIAFRIEDNETKLNASKDREFNAGILELIADKENEGRKSLSIDELKALIK